MASRTRCVLRCAFSWTLFGHQAAAAAAAAAGIIAAAAGADAAATAAPAAAATLTAAVPPLALHRTTVAGAILAAVADMLLLVLIGELRWRGGVQACLRIRMTLARSLLLLKACLPSQTRACLLVVQAGMPRRARMRRAVARTVRLWGARCLKGLGSLVQRMHGACLRANSDGLLVRLLMSTTAIGHLQAPALCNPARYRLLERQQSMREPC